MASTPNPIASATSPQPQPARAAALKIALAYALISALWIIGSDQLVHHLFTDHEIVLRVNTYKGWFFVAFTATLLWWTLNRYFRQLAHAHRQLQDSEQRWQFALDGADHGVWDWNTQTNQIYFSRNYKAMLGYGPEEFGVDLNAWSSRVHSQDLPGVQAKLQQHLEGKTPLYTCEYRLRCKDGSYKWVLDRGKVITRTPDGKPLRAIGTHTDITEHRQAEAARAADAVRRRILVDQSHDGIMVLDESGRVQEANQRFAEMLGYSLPELKALHAWDWDLHLTRAQILEIINTTDAAGWHFETRHRRKNGSFYDVEISINGAIIEDKKLVFCVCRDISQRKQAERALQASEERFRSLVETAPEAIYIRTGKNFVYVNTTAVKLFGVAKPQELLGQPVLERFHPDSRPRISQLMNRLDHNHEGASDMQHVLLRPNGQTLPVIVSAAPFVYQEQPSSLVFVRDMTEHRQLEAQLRQAQKLEAVGQLAGGVAHDFNNILAATMIHLGLLQMNESLDAETRQTLKELEAETHRAVNLTRQLLMFSRRSALEVKPLDLNHVVANLLKMLRRLIGEQIDLRAESQAGLPLVKADTGMVEQVVMNLVVNARDALPTGGRILIRTATVHFAEPHQTPDLESRTGAFVSLSVTDNGCGMDTAIIKHIFEPFFTTKEPGKGTGLGLATVHGIVAQHKGWVEVDSRVGHGTTFHIYLPALTEPAASFTPEAETTTLRRGQETILLVEDDPNVRQTTSQFLRVLGYRVLEADTGQQALAQWHAHEGRIDLLLADMILPEGMTGLELTDHLQQLRPGFRAIICSGYSAEIVQAGVPQKPGVTYLPKPLATKKLADTVRHQLDHHA